MIPNRSRSNRIILFATALIMLLSASSLAQTQDQSQYDHGTPPQHAAGISQIGSYISSDLGTVNLGNGSLNFKIPIGQVGGRGFWLPLTLNYSSKVWSVNTGIDIRVDPPQLNPAAYAIYDDSANAADIYDRVAGGWTIGATPMLRVRGIGISSYQNNQCTDYTYVVVKLTLVLPDKGEVELRDEWTNGAPLGAQLDDDHCRSMDGNRGTRWRATDGSGTIFIADNNNGVSKGNLNGWLITGDGTRYRFDDNSQGSVHSAYLKEIVRASSVTDRNGNKVTISYTSNPDPQSVTFTDQLGRTTKIEYNVNDAQDGLLEVRVTLPGYNGTNRYYKIKTSPMNQHYRSDINPTLPVFNGDADGMSSSYGSPGPHTSLFPNSWGGEKEQIDIKPVLSQLILPDGRSLNFSYNEFGEVAEVQMPTGGKVQYDYAHVGTLPAGNSMHFEIYQTVGNVSEIDRAVVAKRTLPNGGTSIESFWNYSYYCVHPDNIHSETTGGYTDVLARASDNTTLLLNERHLFMDGKRFLTNQGGTGYSLWSTGVEYRTETRDAAGNVLAASEQDWSQRTAVSWPGLTTAEQIANDNRVNEARKILDDGSTSKVHTYYEASINYNNPTEEWEYNFDNTVKRHTVTNYATTINNFNYRGDDIHLLSLPVDQTVYDAGGAQVARTEYEYDQYADDGNNAPLTPYPSTQSDPPPTGHNPDYDASYTKRGNPTSVGHWLNSSQTGRTIYTYTRYDILGNVVSVKDAREKISTISYVDDFGDGHNPGAGASGTNGPTYALPTSVTSPPPNAGQQPHTAYSQYDFSTGLLTGFKDRNGTIAQTIYDDPFDRPTLVKTALGISGLESHARMYYAPATVYNVSLTKNDVMTVKDQTVLDDGLLRSWTRTDGFGRTTEAWSRDPQGDVQVVTNYDGLGRTKQVSNPLRPSLSESLLYTTTIYDLAGRMTAIMTPDNAVVGTSYSGSDVLVKDQAGKQRMSRTNALGELTDVWEIRPSDPASGTVAVTFAGQSLYGYRTSYEYNALGNLKTVTQGQQIRSFVYDSLKRLTSATNPEICNQQGQQCVPVPVTYSYDDNGNLSSKTDARGVITTYDYDALNRVKTRTYSDNTPAVTYIYDTLTNGKGRLTSMSSSSGFVYSYTSYDALGKVLGASQAFGSQPYPMGYSYDLAGHVRTQTYPSGHTVTYNYDNAGRTNSLTGNLGDGATRTYSTGIIYDASSRLTKEQFGTATPIYNKLFYTSRGQLAEIRESTSYTGPTDASYNRGAIINQYSNHGWGAGSDGSDNNGNLQRQEVFIPNDDQGSTFTWWYQAYDYDSLNRLQWVHEFTGNAALDWHQQYVYDRWGNRRIDQTNTWGAGIPKPDFGVNTATNRLTVPAGSAGQMSYDAAGNLTNDTYTGQGARTFDAENRMTQAWANNQWQSYAYDGDGRRVKRNVNGQETWQVYGLGGELIAEYAANASPASPQKEYGYRNGQLLVTATTPAGGWGPTPIFTGPDPLTRGLEIKLENLTELRSAINQLRAHARLSPFVFTVDPNPERNVTMVKADHIRQLRTALEQARSRLGLTVGGYTHPTLTENVSLIYAIDFQELREQVRAAWARGSGEGVRWMVSDQLGTPRMIFDETGSLSGVSRHDYLPFGEEIYADTGLRVATQGYSGIDSVRQKFTQKERDAETGLDYFLARYYSSSMGRFLSADPIFLMMQKLFDPQQWNMYSYARSNPVRFVDPTGKYICSDNGKCESDDDKAFEAARQKALNSSDKKVRQAAQAYGDPTVDNKVYVGFGVKQSTEGGEVSFGVGKDGKYDGTIHVTFSREQMTTGGDSLALGAVVVHEGQHVLDDKNIIDHGYDPKYVITHRQSERNAYAVEERYIEAETREYNSKTREWENRYNPDWTSTKAIDKYLDNDPKYKNLDSPLIDTSKVPQQKIQQAKPPK